MSASKIRGLEECENIEDLKKGEGIELLEEEAKGRKWKRNGRIRNGKI